jgi:hypothetical protein
MSGAHVLFAGKTRPSEQELLKKEFVLLGRGDVLKARMVYIYLAINGSADAARGVCDTYNPSLLKEIPNGNALGNDSQAVYWYQRGAEMEPSAGSAFASR